MAKSNTTWSFIDHVTDSLKRKRSGDPKHPTLWPSEATAVYTDNDGEKVAGKCRRATFFRFLLENFSFYPEKYHYWQSVVTMVKEKSLPVDAYLLWIWRQGELYEEFLIEQAKISGVYLDSQVPMYIKEFNVSGKIDIEVINPITHKRSIVESKSVYGFGAKDVLGTPSDRAKNKLGKPKDSNLLQVAIYDWWVASADTAFEHSRLVYGARDTGIYGEYLIRTVDEGDNIFIEYSPDGGSNWTRTPYTINSIMNSFAEQQKALDSGVIPKRDFDILYTEAQLDVLYCNDELTKAEKEQYEKVIARRIENVERIANGQNPKVELKQVRKGSWQCDLCQFRTVCYDSQTLTPNTL